MAHLSINTTPAEKEKVHLGELNIFVSRARRAWQPGVCIRTLMASIVAGGFSEGIDFTQERRYAGPHLEAIAARFTPASGRSSLTA